MKQPIASLGIALLAAIAPLKANAASFSQLYVIGDSLLDPGNLFQVTQGIVPQTPPYAGNFSNGPLWVELLAEELELAPALVTDFSTFPDISDGINFAFGGAGTGFENVIAPNDLPGTGALAQAILFASLGLQPAEDALFIYLAGANDLAGSTVIPPQTDISVPLANTLNALQLLLGAGAQNILVSNLPDLSLTPRFNGLPEPEVTALSELVTAYNAGLSEIVDGLATGVPTAEFIEFDFNGLFLDTVENADSFGFTNVTNSCLGDFTPPFDFDFSVCDDPDSYLFWDDFHPTTQANEIVASAVLTQLQASKSVPEPNMGWVVIVFGAIATGTVLSRSRISSL